MPFSGDAIRASLFASLMTGAEGKQIIITSLESKGLMLDNKHQYPLSEIHAHFKNLFGERLAAIIFEAVKADLIQQT